MNCKNKEAPEEPAAVVKVGEEAIPPIEINYGQTLMAAIARHGYPVKANPGQIDSCGDGAVLAVCVIFVTMVYRPNSGLARRAVRHRHTLSRAVAALPYR